MTAGEARFWQPGPDGRVTCLLCAHHCKIPSGKRGLCRVRENRGGTLQALNHGLLLAASLDPIEKKPLHHVLPGSGSFSIAAAGCNFRCRFCQNADISQVAEGEAVAGVATSAGKVVESARAAGARSIAYTYTEPTVYWETVEEVSTLARAAGLKNVWVSNGFLSPELCEVAGPLMDAANIDLKSFSDRFYREECGGRLEPVLETIRTLRGLGVWLEVTTLLIPGLNTDGGELRELTAFLSSVDPEMPWHVSRFFPRHRRTELPPTSLTDIRAALAIGRQAGLLHVYSGNTGPDDEADTRCPGCGELLVRRHGYDAMVVGLEHGACRKCRRPLAGIWR